MYVYQLTPYLKRRLYKYSKGSGTPRGYFEWEYVKAVYPEASYEEHHAFSVYGDVTVYSPTKLTKVPARNGVLLPVRFYTETSIN